MHSQVAEGGRAACVHVCMHGGCVHVCACACASCAHCVHVHLLVHVCAFVYVVYVHCGYVCVCTFACVHTHIHVHLHVRVRAVVIDAASTRCERWTLTKPVPRGQFGDYWRWSPGQVRMSHVSEALQGSVLTHAVLGDTWGCWRGWGSKQTSLAGSSVPGFGWFCCAAQVQPWKGLQGCG